MTRHSSGLLTDLYEAPPELITVIAHGVPLIQTLPSIQAKAKTRVTRPADYQYFWTDWSR